MSRVLIGRILRVNLSTNDIKVETWNTQEAEKYIGALGIVARKMFEEINQQTQPYDPENLFIWATGALVGTRGPAINKSIVISKSPLTNCWGDAIFSAFAGIQLKWAGYDAVVVEGKSEKPVYIWIKDEDVEIRNASNLWGKGLHETFKTIKDELKDSKTSIIGIGPSGEKLVRIANVISDDWRAAGRCGLGSVMGSKNLKAIAVRGEGEIKVDDEDKFNSVKEKILKIIVESTAAKNFRLYGTSAGVVAFEQMGNLPVKNWSRGTFPAAYEISGQKMAETILVRSKSCFGCPMACGRVVKIEEGPYALPGEVAGPEYETIAALGSLIMNSNLQSIAKGNYICNDYGVDTISAGSAIAFAMELFEKGIISEGDTGGIELRWGDPDTMLKMIELIVKKEGFGAILGEGVKQAAKIIGKGSNRYAMHVKGLELPFHNPYRLKAMGLQYATCNRGACHNRGSPGYVERGILSPELGLDTKVDPFIEKGKGKITKIHQDACTFIDAIGACKFNYFFPRVPLTLLADLYVAATGFKVTLEELLKAAERIWLIERAFNIKMGIDRKDDRLPERFLKEPVPDGAIKGQTVNLDIMLEEYYKERGYDEQGRPSIEKLRELGLDFIIPVIYGS